MMTFDPGTRRDFVKAGATTLVGAAASTLTKTITAEERRQPGPRKTIETDVLVCGGGCAGTYQKPHALAFAGAIVAMGMTARWITHHRAEIGDRVVSLVGQIRDLTAGSAEAIPTLSGPRFLVATLGNPKLVAFAIEQAKQAQAELLFLFVRHIAVPTLGPSSRPDITRDPVAQQAALQIQEQASAAGVPIRFLYTEADNIAETIVDFAVTYGVNRVMIGATKRGALWRTMKGDVIQGIALHLPEQTQLLIQA